MTTNLTANKIKDTYSQLLHVDGGPAATEKVVYSGTGVATALKVGTVSASVDNVRVAGSTVSTTNTNGDLTLAPNGTGSVVIPKVTYGDQAQARMALGLGTAALSDTGDFATAAQGELASTAVQPGSIGTIAAQNANNVAITGGTIQDVAFTGAFTVNGIAIFDPRPTLSGLDVTTKNKAATLDYVAGVNVNNFTGAAAQAVTLPAAVAGVTVIHAQSVDTAGGVLTLSFTCAGTDVFETGSVIPSRVANAVAFAVSTAGQATLVYTPAAAATNLFSLGSYIYFSCTSDGIWRISYSFQHLSTGNTGVFAFEA
jgi:hypothetical protein